MKYTYEKHNGYTIAVPEDGYVHHATANHKCFYPYALDDEGKLRNQTGMYKVDELIEMINDKKAVWG